MTLTVRERLQALLDGKKIIFSPGSITISYDLEYFVDNLYSSPRLFSSGEKWEIAEEPKLELTPDDVGKKVKHRNGNISIIVTFEIDKNKQEIFATNDHRFRKNGKHWFDNEYDNEFDIVEILPRYLNV